MTQYNILLIGAGQFGATFIAQMKRVPSLHLKAVCDIDTDKARRLVESAGLEDVTIIDNAEAIGALGVDLVIEATGFPRAGARHAKLAIEAGCHVAMVTKEIEITVGPILHRLASERGLAYTPVDGDQPNLLIKLYRWAERLGFDIVAAGKATEYDAVIADDCQTITSHEATLRWNDMMFYWQGDDIAALVEARAQGLEGAMRQTVPDLCEMGIVANYLGLDVDLPALHAPILRTCELADAFAPSSDGGLLRYTGVVDAFSCLRRYDELSFAGGVFVIVRCTDDTTAKLLARKGLVVSRNSQYLMLHNPIHLLGSEAVVSVLEACEANGPIAPAPTPRYDLVAVSDIDFTAGQTLTMGARHSIPGTRPELRPARRQENDAPIPYYLAMDLSLVCNVHANTPITWGDVGEIPADSFAALRQMQEETFR